MTKLKIHYDGWVALPAAIRRRFGVTTGDQLDAEWVDGGLLLRSPKGGEPANDVTPEEDVVVRQTAPKPVKKRTPKPSAKKAEKPVAGKSSGRLAASTIPRARGRRKAGVG